MDNVKQVTEREWMQMFEQLPPTGWKSANGAESWYCPEMYSGDTTMIGVRIGSDYYLYSGLCTDSHEQRVQNVQSAIDADEIEQSKHYAASAEHGEEAWQAFCDMVGEEYADPEQFADAYCGEWDSERAYSDNLLEECYSEQFATDSITARYFDYDAFCRDLFISDCTYINGHVFNNNF